MDRTLAIILQCGIYSIDYRLRAQQKQQQTTTTTTTMPEWQVECACHHDLVIVPDSTLFVCLFVYLFVCLFVCFVCSFVPSFQCWISASKFFSYGSMIYRGKMLQFHMNLKIL